MSRIIKPITINTDLAHAQASRDRQALRLEKKRKKQERKDKLKAQRQNDLAHCLGTKPVKKKPVKKATKKFIVNPISNEFLESYAWRRVRMEALKRHGAICQCCGASRKTGAVIHVDHIKPRKLFPNLALDIDNLQVLCHECNHGKGNWDMTDWR